MKQAAATAVALQSTFPPSLTPSSADHHSIPVRPSSPLSVSSTTSSGTVAYPFPGPSGFVASLKRERTLTAGTTGSKKRVEKYGSGSSSAQRDEVDSGAGEPTQGDDTVL